MKSVLTAALVSILASTSSHAVVYVAQYSDTLTAPLGSIPTGSAVTISIGLDNGGSTYLSQSWGDEDAQWVKFDIGSGTIITTFTAPFGGDGFSNNAGTFATDASGTFTSVPTSWFDVSVASDYTTNDSNPALWFINGANGVYASDTGDASLSNVSGDIVASNWTISSVPEPSQYAAAAGLVVLALVGLRRRKTRVA